MPHNATMVDAIHFYCFPPIFSNNDFMAVVRCWRFSCKVKRRGRSTLSSLNFRKRNVALAWVHSWILSSVCWVSGSFSSPLRDFYLPVSLSSRANTFSFNSILSESNLRQENLPLLFIWTKLLNSQLKLLCKRAWSMLETAHCSYVCEQKLKRNQPFPLFLSSFFRFLVQVFSEYKVQKPFERYFNLPWHKY